MGYKFNYYLLTVTFSFIFVVMVRAQNPIIQTSYTPDPAPMVYNDTLFLYTGCDADTASYFDMNEWQVFSTVDMVNWTDHGVQLSYKDFKWTKPKSAWAAQCIERNGKFYWYVCCEYPGNWHVIGVAVSDRPTGPFKDAISKPLVYTGKMGDIDPTVYIDDDGQAYLYWGNGKVCYVKLNEDMISYDKEMGIVELDMNKEQFEYLERNDPNRANTLFEEGPWLYKRNGLYYMIYAAGGIPEYIAYSTASSFNGPWTYRDVIMNKGYEDLAFTNHPGIVDYKGKSYFFYHNQGISKHGFRRSTCIEEFNFNADGTFPNIKPTKEGVSPIATLNPYRRTEAETMAWGQGVKTKKDSKGGVYLTSIHNNDYIKVKNVDFAKGAKSIEVVATPIAGGEIEIRLDEADGALIGICKIDKTGNSDTWGSFSAKVKKTGGIHDLFFVFKGADGELFNLDYWIFK